MYDQKTVLKTAYEGLEQELSRISYLLKPIKNHPLGEYAERIQSKFVESKSAVQNALREIKQALDGKGKSLEEGWCSYMKLKTELMPSLSSELLAVIGGVYLIKANLDHVGDFEGDFSQEDRKPTMSFSEIAQILVEDLAKRGGKGWAPVLIVGEERLGYSVAEIIRLRFPACDIWHLPFTAHEYGYLVAQTRPPDLLGNFRAYVRHNVDPKQHQNNTSPSDRFCFLEEIQRLWDHYYNNLRAEEREKFSQTHKLELSALAKEQETHLCRLFADAFATFFVGPAYVYALLHLRFAPDETLYKPSVGMPAFAHRFVFALETLKWMNDEPILMPDTDRPPFADEVNDTTGIPDLWRETAKSINREDYYGQIAKNYEPWLIQTKEILKTSFSASFDDTLVHWRIAKGLKDTLLKIEWKVKEWPPMWAVLNAAWLARLSQPAQWKAIQANTHRLLGTPDPTFIERKGSPTGPMSSAPKEEERWSVEQAVEIVKEALVTDPDSLYKFEAMVQSGRYRKDDAMLSSLFNINRDAYDIFVQLIQKLPSPGIL